MRLFFSLIFLFMFTSTHAAEVNNLMLIDGEAPDYKLIFIINHPNEGYVYAENYDHQKILIYKSPHLYQPQSVFSSAQLNDTDILEVGFECYKLTCTRYFNRRTNQLSKIYSDILDYDAKRDVIAFYEKDKNKIVFSRAFKVCKKPFIYPIKLEKDSDFGIKTKFLSSGDLQLDYEAHNGEDVLKAVHFNYGNFLRGCS